MYLSPFNKNLIINYKDIDCVNDDDVIANCDSLSTQHFAICTPLPDENKTKNVTNVMQAC